MTYPPSKLRDVAEFIRGITFKPDDVVSLDAEDAVVCMRTKNVQTLLDCDDLLAVPSQFVRRKDQYLEEGDILVSSANSWNLVGKCCWVHKLPWRAAFGGFISVLRGDPTKVDRRYLYWWFASNRIQALLRSFGQKTTNISNLNIERCLQLELPLPPLHEQRRIAAILDKADALRTKRHEALAQLDRLAQSIFVEMFGDPVMNPKGWTTIGLGEFFQFRTGKLDSNAAEENGLYPFFTCSRDNLSINSYAFDCEALLLAGNNANADYSVKHYIGKFNAYQRTYVINLLDESNSYRYAAFILENKLGELKRSSKGSNTKYLTLEILQRIKIPLPPQRLQTEFAEKLAKLNLIKGRQMQELVQFDALFQSIQHRAFQGEL